jgi:hypothetical protein
VFDDVGRGGSQCLWPWLGVAGARGGEGCGDSAGGGYDEVATADRGVDDGDAEQRALGVWGVEGISDEGVERLV